MQYNNYHMVLFYKYVKQVFSLHTCVIKVHATSLEVDDLKIFTIIFVVPNSQNIFYGSWVNWK